MSSKVTNARAELVKRLPDNNIPLRNIQAAQISFGVQYEPYDKWEWETLYPGHSDSEFDQWLSKINEFEYDAGYGCQFLFGTIWLKNNLWMTRGEYDGSEWWVICRRPPLPKKDKS